MGEFIAFLVVCTVMPSLVLGSAYLVGWCDYMAMRDKENEEGSE